MVFDQLWNHGHVFKGPDYFLLGYELPEHRAWVVWWAETPGHRDPISLFLLKMPHYQPWVGWGRGKRPGAKFKFYSTDRLLRRIGDHAAQG